MIRFIAVILLTFICSAALAANSREEVVDKWYEALAGADRSAFGDLLADDAVITLNDLDVEQTKKEFIGSLDEWQDAMKDTKIEHKVETVTPETVSILVCYKFPDNETLGREVFRVENGKIKESVQTTIGDSCADY